MNGGELPPGVASAHHRQARELGLCATNIAVEHGGRGLSMLQQVLVQEQGGRVTNALAWVMAQPGITSPIVGVTKPEHLADAVAAVDLELTDAELEELGAGYVPHAIAGHR